MSTTLVAAICGRFAAPEWHCETEVTIGKRRLDLVALNTWPSRGYRLVGFEVKQSRSDWLRELEAFEKSRETAIAVDEFYLVTAPEVVTATHEIPEGWGWLELKGTKLRTKIVAPRIRTSSEMAREMAVRLLMRGLARATNSLADIRNDEIELIRSEERERVGRDLQTAKDKAEMHARENREILEALGLKREHFAAHEDALKAAGLYARAQGGHEIMRRHILHEAEMLTRHAKDLARIAGELPT